MSELQNLRGRQQVITALLYAAENALKIVEFCLSSSPDASVSARELAAFTGMSELQAQVILDMQVRRLSPFAVAQMRVELREVESRITSLGGQ